MGFIFSKPKSPSERLFEYEEQILNTEANLINLRRNRVSIKTMLFGLILLVCSNLIFEINIMVSTAAGILLDVALYIFAMSIRGRSIRMSEYKLKKLKEEQKNFVQTCKEDIKFAKTRRLIEKYEADESRDIFFNTVIDRKKTGIDKFADLILANDPAKMNALICKCCGYHNGLIDPKNSDIKFFYCYNCKEKNERI
ncbi:hypothetical protein NUSPORA_01199 [Nucleospora cyclopteri]